MQRVNVEVIARIEIVKHDGIAFLRLHSQPVSRWIAREGTLIRFSLGERRRLGRLRVPACQREPRLSNPIEIVLPDRGRAQHAFGSAKADHSWGDREACRFDLHVRTMRLAARGTSQEASQCTLYSPPLE